MQAISETRDVCRTVFENGVAVLMARIVDGASRCVEPADVAAIGYSILETGSRSKRARVVAGHDCRRLDVDEVFGDSLTCDASWDLDVAGYNFRHEIHANPDASFPKADARYEVRYLFLPKSSEPVIIRFHLRIQSP